MSTATAPPSNSKYVPSTHEKNKDMDTVHEKTATRATGANIAEKL